MQYNNNIKCLKFLTNRNLWLCRSSTPPAPQTHPHLRFWLTAIPNNESSIWRELTVTSRCHASSLKQEENTFSEREEWFQSHTIRWLKYVEKKTVLCKPTYLWLEFILLYLSPLLYTQDKRRNIKKHYFFISQNHIVCKNTKHFEFQSLSLHCEQARAHIDIRGGLSTCPFSSFRKSALFSGDFFFLWIYVYVCVCVCVSVCAQLSLSNK